MFLADYTQGVRGVGIVNGMEILSAFLVDEDPTEGLKKFKTWLDGFDPLDMLKGTDVSNMMTEERRFHQKHKSARNRWDAPPNFPAKEAEDTERVLSGSFSMCMAVCGRNPGGKFCLC